MAKRAFNASTRNSDPAILAGWEVISLDLYRNDRLYLGDRKIGAQAEADISFSLRVDIDKLMMEIDAEFDIENHGSDAYSCELVARGYFDCADDASIDELVSYARMHAIARLYDHASLYLKMVSSFGTSEPLLLPPFSTRFISQCD